MKQYQLLALRRFNDGNAYPNKIEKDEKVVVTERQKTMMLNSDPEGFMVLGLYVPKSEPAPEPEPKRKKSPPAKGDE